MTRSALIGVYNSHALLAQGFVFLVVRHNYVLIIAITDCMYEYTYGENLPHITRLSVDSLSVRLA